MTLDNGNEMMEIGEGSGRILSDSILSQIENVTHDTNSMPGPGKSGPRATLCFLQWIQGN